MKKSSRRSSVLSNGERNLGRNFDTKFSLPTFVKRVNRLTDNQRNAINRVGFGRLLLIPNKMLRRNLLVELMERWNCEKQAFVLLPGEIKIKLIDVAVILGLRVTGQPVVLDAPFSILEMEYGAALWNRKITVASIQKRLDILGEADNEDFVRCFLLFTFGIFLFPNANRKVDSRYLSLLRDLGKASSFAWGAAVLEDIINWLCRRKKENVQCIGGCLIFLQIWSYEHINLARPGILSILTFPRICRWGNIKSSERERFSLKFQELNMSQIVWDLQLTPDESEIDVIKEIPETRGETAYHSMSISSLTKGLVDNVYNIGSRPEGEQGVIDIDGESDMDLEEVQGPQIDTSKQLRLSPNSSVVSIDRAISPHTSHDVLREPREQGKHPWVTQGTSTIILISDDEDDLTNQVLEEPNELKEENAGLRREVVYLKRQLLLRSKSEEQNVQLRKEVEYLKKQLLLTSKSEEQSVELRKEVDYLKKQLLLSSKSEEQNVELRKEVEELRRSQSSSACLVARLERIVLEENVNTAGEKTTKSGDFEFNNRHNPLLP